MEIERRRRLERLTAVLDREIAIDTVGAFVAAAASKAAASKAKRTDRLGKIAFCFDTNACLRIGNMPRGEYVIDYFSEGHEGPLILPAQVVQESWNNMHAIDTVAKAVRNKFDDLKAEVEKVDKNFGDFADRMDLLLKDFAIEYGHVYNGATDHKVMHLLETLQNKAFLSHVPRSRFNDMAIHRKRTKTPPGFKDDGDGDFFLWLEFLNGLLEAKDAGKYFDHAVLVTQDTKKDWSRAGVAHPVLKAEIRELLGVSFDVWTLEELSAAVAREVGLPSAQPAGQPPGAAAPAPGAPVADPATAQQPTPNPAPAADANANENDTVTSG